MGTCASSPSDESKASAVAVVPTAAAAAGAGAGSGARAVADPLAGRGIPLLTHREVLSEPTGRKALLAFMEREMSAENMKFFEAVEELRAAAYAEALHAANTSEVLAYVTAAFASFGGDAGLPVPPLYALIGEYARHTLSLRANPRVVALAMHVVDMHLRNTSEAQVPAPGMEYHMFSTWAWGWMPLHNGPVQVPPPPPDADPALVASLRTTGWDMQRGVEPPAVRYWLDHAPPLPTERQWREAALYFGRAVPDVETYVPDDAECAALAAALAERALNASAYDEQRRQRVLDGLDRPPSYWLPPERWYPTPFDRIQLATVRNSGRDTFPRFRESAGYRAWVHALARSGADGLRKVLWADHDTCGPAGPKLRRRSLDSNEAP